MIFGPNEWQWTDSTGLVMPWFTRPFLDLLDQWRRSGVMLHGREVPLLRTWKVFEWGAGYSTTWWASNCAELQSCEADPAWSSAVARDLEEHSVAHRVKQWTVDPVTSPDIYAKCARPGPYDCLVIDGSERVDCAEEAIRLVAPGGVIILDNSEVEEFKPIFGLLRHHDCHTFPQPGHPHWCTTYWRINDHPRPPASPEMAALEQRKRRGME